MAKIKLSPLFESVCGTISRRTLADGRTETVYVTRSGRLATRISGEPTPRVLTPGQIHARHRFAAISQAVHLICQRADLPCDALARQYLTPFVKDHYNQLPDDRDQSRDAETLCQAFCSRFSSESQSSNIPITGSSPNSTPTTPQPLN